MPWSISLRSLLAALYISFCLIDETGVSLAILAKICFGLTAACVSACIILSVNSSISAVDWVGSCAPWWRVVMDRMVCYEFVATLVLDQADLSLEWAPSRSCTALSDLWLIFMCRLDHKGENWIYKARRYRFSLILLSIQRIHALLPSFDKNLLPCQRYYK